MIRSLLAAALALACIGAHGVHAQSYPNRPVRLVVASSPGGGSDILARMFAQKLTEDFAQQVVVDNRGGASGVIGTDIVAKVDARRLHAADHPAFAHDQSQHDQEACRTTRCAISRRSRWWWMRRSC